MSDKFVGNLKIAVLKLIKMYFLRLEISEETRIS
jgi:hypothetical protein